MGVEFLESELSKWQSEKCKEAIGVGATGLRGSEKVWGSLGRSLRGSPRGHRGPLRGPQQGRVFDISHDDVILPHHAQETPMTWELAMKIKSKNGEDKSSLKIFCFARALQRKTLGIWLELWWALSASCGIGDHENFPLQTPGKSIGHFPEFLWRASKVTKSDEPSCPTTIVLPVLVDIVLGQASFHPCLCSWKSSDRTREKEREDQQEGRGEIRGHLNSRWGMPCGSHSFFGEPPNKHRESLGHPVNS